MSLDGTYTRMLRKALNIHWSSHIPNQQLYGDLPAVSNKIASRRLQLAGHCYRHPELSTQKLVLWEPTHGHRGRGRPNTTYIDTLKRDTGAFEASEIAVLMADKRLWKDLVVACLRATKWVSEYKTNFFIPSSYYYHCENPVYTRYTVTHFASEIVILFPFRGSYLKE